MSSPGKLNRLLIFPAALALLLLIHFQYLGNPFLHDDTHSIIDNPHIRTLKNIPRYFVSGSMFSADYSSIEYRPILLASYALNWAISGPKPWSYRLLNLILHALNAVLLISLLERWRSGKWAVVAGMLFLLNPMAGKVFVLVSARSALLGATSLLLCLITYDRATDGDNGGWYMLSLAAAALGLFSIASAVVIFGFIFMFETGAHAGAPLRRRMLRVTPFGILVVAYLFLRHALLGSSMGDNYVRPVESNAVMQLKILYIYLKMSLIPIDYPLFYEVAEARSWRGLFSTPVILATLLTAAWFALGLRKLVARRAAPMWIEGMLLLWPILACLPYAVVPLNVPVAEHHFYASLAGLSGLAAFYFRNTWEKYPRIVTIGLVLIIVSFAGVLNHRDRAWGSAFALSAEAVRLGPNSARAWNELGAAYTADSRYEKAIPALRRALKIEPGNIGAYYNLGINYFYMGRYEEAARVLLKFRELASRTKRTNYEDGIIGMALVRSRQAQRALPFLNRALEMAPKRRDVLLDKIRALLELNLPADAVETCNIMLSSNPKDAEALMSRSRAKFMADDVTGAKADMDNLLALGIHAPEAIVLQVQILRKMNRPGEALDALNAAINRAPGLGILWELKGGVLEDMLRYSEALAAWRAALPLARLPQEKLFVESKIRELDTQSRQ